MIEEKTEVKLCEFPELKMVAKVIEMMKLPVTAWQRNKFIISLILMFLSDQL